MTDVQSKRTRAHLVGSGIKITVFQFEDEWVLHIDGAEGVNVHKRCRKGPGPLISWAEKWARDRGFVATFFQGNVSKLVTE